MTRVTTDCNGRKHLTDESLLHLAKREWVGLTVEEKETIVDARTVDNQGYDMWCDGRGVADDVEARLKEKNT